MDQLKKLYASLSLKQKISIGIAALVILLGIVGFSKWHKEQDFKPLYTGVAPEDAAGLPKSGRIGFELFDKTTFGATEFVGELERSIGNLSAVGQALKEILRFDLYRDGASRNILIRLR